MHPFGKRSYLAGRLLLEYSFMIPATRWLDAQGWSLGQMKISQEVMTLIVFVPFMIYCLNNPSKWIISGQDCAYWRVCILYLQSKCVELLFY